MLLIWWSRNCQEKGHVRSNTKDGILVAFKVRKSLYTITKNETAMWTMTKNKRASIVWYKTISFCHALVSGSTSGMVSVTNPQLSIILKAVSNRIHPKQQVAHMLQPLRWPSPPIGRGSLTSSWVTGLARHKRYSWQMWFGVASEVINGCSDYRPYHTTTHPLGIKLKQQGLCQMPFSLFPMPNVLLPTCIVTFFFKFACLKSLFW